MGNIFDMHSTHAWVRFSELNLVNNKVRHTPSTLAKRTFMNLCTQAKSRINSQRTRWRKVSILLTSTIALFSFKVLSTCVESAQPRSLRLTQNGIVSAVHTLHRGLIIKSIGSRSSSQSDSAVAHAHRPHASCFDRTSLVSYFISFSFSPLAPPSFRYDTPLKPLVPFFGARAARPHRGRIVHSGSSSSRVALAAHGQINR